jgi:hypothetical protein
LVILRVGCNDRLTICLCLPIVAIKSIYDTAFFLKNQKFYEHEISSSPDIKISTICLGTMTLVQSEFPVATWIMQLKEEFNFLIRMCPIVKCPNFWRPNVILNLIKIGRTEEKISKLKIVGPNRMEYIRQPLIFLKKTYTCSRIEFQSSSSQTDSHRFVSNALPERVMKHVLDNGLVEIDNWAR